MQIELSTEEYRTLLGVLEIADWVLFAHRSDRPNDRKEYHDFEQKVFGYAGAFGLDNLIEYVQKHQEYFPTQEYEENSPVQPFIDEFEDHVFWRELVDRLATRDMLRELGEKKVQAMAPKERFMALQDHERRYSEEFEGHGLERLGIKE
jgi:hypothetical protein